MRGFSLVELSIVLVILGLLTGGILAGQNLIRASELRAVTTEIQRFSTSANTFRDKYFAIPGDFNKAEDFWGTATCPGDHTTPSTSAATCNGDGDGRVEQGTTINEAFRFWQHLANAGLIEGNYTGVPRASGQFSVDIGVNIPKSKLGQGGYYVTAANTYSGNAILYDGNYGNFFRFGGNPSGNQVTVDPIIRPEEAWNIDTKLDDGMPGMGNVRATKQSATSSPNCTTSDTAATAEYALTSTSVLCALNIIAGF